MRASCMLALAAGIMLVCCGDVACAKTWRLEKGGEWRAVSEDEQGRYVLAVAEVKQLVSSGETEAAQKALANLKEDFPEIAGAELEAFMEAEMLFAGGKFDKAVRSYNRFMDEYPRSELFASALERQFQVATAYLAGHKRRVLKLFSMRGYNEGVKIMDRIAARTGNAPIAKRAMFAVAKSYEERGKFTDAYETWRDISSRWPSGETGREALLGTARSMHAAYRGPKYDATSLISARGYYRDLQMRHPEFAEEIGVGEVLAQIEEQLAYKQFAIGRYYDGTGSELAANLYYQYVADGWPDSTAAKLVTKTTEKGISQGREK